MGSPTRLDEAPTFMSLQLRESWQKVVRLAGLSAGTISFWVGFSILILTTTVTLCYLHRVSRKNLRSPNVDNSFCFTPEQQVTESRYQVLISLLYLEPPKVPEVPEACLVLISLQSDELTLPYSYPPHGSHVTQNNFESSVTTV